MTLLLVQVSSVIARNCHLHTTWGTKRFIQLICAHWSFDRIPSVNDKFILQQSNNNTLVLSQTIVREISEAGAQASVSISYLPIFQYSSDDDI